jgi:hypothetical protein
MHMHSRLACCLPDIYPDVVSVGRVLGIDTLPGIAQKLNNRGLFLGRHFEEVGHMAFRNHEDMTTTQRMIVRAHVGQLVLEQNRLRGTEFTLLRLLHRIPFVLLNDVVSCHLQRAGTAAPTAPLLSRPRPHGCVTARS